MCKVTALSGCRTGYFIITYTVLAKQTWEFTCYYLTTVSSDQFSAFPHLGPQTVRG